MADKAQAVADTLLGGGPTPHHLRHRRHAAEVVAEDDTHQAVPDAIDKDEVHVVPVEQMFEKQP